MNKKNTCILLLQILLFVTCKRNDTNTCVKDMLSGKINLCLNHMERIDSCLSKDTVIPRYTMVCYFDSTECQTCATSKLYLWNNFMKKYDSYVDINYVFIFSPTTDSYLLLRAFLESKKEKKNIFIDTLKVFEKENSFIPQSLIYHTFLVDNKRNEIKLVGDPRRNKKIEGLFVEIIANKNSQPTKLSNDLYP